MAGAQRVAISPDGKSVYVASLLDRAIVRFDRDVKTGALTPRGCIGDIGMTDCETNAQGLNGAEGVVVSPDGKSVHVGSFVDRAVVSFARDTQTGAREPVISPDGKSVYVAASASTDAAREGEGQREGALVRFRRDPADRALSRRGCIGDPRRPLWLRDERARNELSPRCRGEPRR